MKCSACNELNEGNMQFCINCGQTLSSQVNSQFSSSNPPNLSTVPPYLASSGSFASQAVPDLSNAILVCTKCGKTDPLHGQYCVYCGGRTAVGANQTNNFVPLSNQTIVPDNAQAVNFSRQNENPSSSVTHGVNKSGSLIKAMFLIFSLILGSVVGFFGIYTFKDQLENLSLQSFFPKEGVLVYTALPNTNFRIQDNKQRSMLLGITSNSGSVFMNSLSPGAHNLKLISDRGKEMIYEFNVNHSDPVVIGYPKPLIFEK